MHKPDLRGRAVTTLLMLFGSVVLAVSGVVLLIVPRGRTVHALDWSLMSLSKETWEEVHLAFAALFLIVAAVHIWLNHKVLLHYIRERLTRGRERLVLGGITLDCWSPPHCRRCCWCWRSTTCHRSAICPTSSSTPRMCGKLARQLAGRVPVGGGVPLGNAEPRWPRACCRGRKKQESMMDNSLSRGGHAPVPWSGTVLALCLLASSMVGAQQPVSFKNNIAPIFENHCVECHQPGGRGYEASGLDLRSYEGLMRGTRFGSVVVPGDVFSSNLVRIVQGQVASQIRMPYQHQPLSESQTLAIQRWVLEGAKNN